MLGRPRSGLGRARGFAGPAPRGSGGGSRSLGGGGAAQSSLLPRRDGQPDHLPAGCPRGGVGCAAGHPLAAVPSRWCHPLIAQPRWMVGPVGATDEPSVASPARANGCAPRNSRGRLACAGRLGFTIQCQARSSTWRDEPGGGGFAFLPAGAGRELPGGHVEPGRGMGGVFAFEPVSCFRLPQHTDDSPSGGQPGGRASCLGTQRRAGRPAVARITLQFRRAAALALPLHAEAGRRTAHRVRKLFPGFRRHARGIFGDPGSRRAFPPLAGRDHGVSDGRCLHARGAGHWMAELSHEGHGGELCRLPPLAALARAGRLSGAALS